MLGDEGSSVWEEEEQGILWKIPFWWKNFASFESIFFVITSTKEIV